MSEEAIAFRRRYGTEPGMEAPMAEQMPMPEMEMAQGHEPGMYPGMAGMEPGMDPGMMGMDPMMGGMAGDPNMPGARMGGVDTNAFTITFRAVSIIRTSNQPEANKSIAYSVVDEIRANPLFDPDATRFIGDVGNEEPPGTFTFSVTTKLKRQMKL
jgi:hypothetical protein